GPRDAWIHRFQEFSRRRCRAAFGSLVGERRDLGGLAQSSSSPTRATAWSRAMVRVLQSGSCPCGPCDGFFQRSSPKGRGPAPAGPIISILSKSRGVFVDAYRRTRLSTAPTLRP